MALDTPIYGPTFYNKPQQREDLPATAGQGHLIAYNMSRYELSIELASGRKQFLPAFTARVIQLCGETFFLWDVIEAMDTESPPTDYVLFEHIQPGLFASVATPMARSANVGNIVATNPTTTERIINTESGPNTPIIRSHVEGQMVDDVTISNDGQAIIGPYFFIKGNRPLDPPDSPCAYIGDEVAPTVLKGHQEIGSDSFPSVTVQHDQNVFYRRDLRRWFTLDWSSNAWVAGDSRVLPWSQEFLNPYTATAIQSWRCRLPYGGDVNSRFFGAFDLLVAQSVAGTASNHHVINVFQRWEGTAFSDVLLGSYNTINLGANQWARIAVAGVTLPTWKPNGIQSFVEMRVAKNVAHSSSLFVQPELRGREGYIIV